MSINTNYVDYDLKKALILLQIGITKNLNDEEMDVILRYLFQGLIELRENVRKQSENEREKNNERTY